MFREYRIGTWLFRHSKFEIQLKNWDASNEAFVVCKSPQHLLELGIQ